MWLEGVLSSTVQSHPSSVRDVGILDVWLARTPHPCPPKLDLMPTIRGYPHGFGWVRTRLPYQT
jgi:hypothetical protein